MSEWFKVADTAEIEPGQGKCVTIGKYNIAVFNVEGQFYAVSDDCPHAGASLAEGSLSGKEITCPWHEAIFDITSGQCMQGPATDNIGCYKIQIEGSDLKVELPS